MNFTITGETKGKLSIELDYTIRDTDSLTEDGLPIKIYSVNRYRIVPLEGDLTIKDATNLMGVLINYIYTNGTNLSDRLLSQEVGKINDLLNDLGIDSKLDTDIVGTEDDEV